MSCVNPDPVAYYDAIAGEYDSSLLAEERTRRAFRQLVYDFVPPGALILDFGCGTGLDAAAYAEHAYKVLAWDPAEGMRRAARHRCAAHLQSARVTLLDSFRPETLPAKPVAITANFAVTSLIRDLRAQFEVWAQCLDEGGRLLISVQNPWYYRDLRERWFWRGFPQLVWRGEFRVPGSHLFRRRIGAVSAAAAPFFRSERCVFRAREKFCFLVYRRWMD